MPRSVPVGAGLLAAVVLAACGGSGHSTSSSSGSSAPAATSTSTSTAAATSTIAPASTQTSATSTVSAGPTSTTATTTARPPEVPRGRRSQHSTGATPSSGVRIPAAFIIHTGGSLLPPLISAPKGVTVELRIFDQDSKPHTVTLAAPGHPTLRLKPLAQATEDVTGLRNGTYRLLIDGKTGARLVIGAVPGP